MYNVMIVDDDKLARLGLMNSVSWHEYDMRVIFDTASGEAAVDFARNNRVDLAFIDLEMPGMFGLELLEKLSKISPMTKCAIVTMHDEFQYIQEALRIGILDYIIKTELGGEQLLGVIHRLKNRMSALKERHVSEKEPFEGTEFSSEIRHCIAQAVSIIEEEQGTYLTATEVAARVNMSRSYFSTCFKQLMGVTFNEYFKQVRLESAKTNLITTDDSVHDIAQGSGFSDEHYFSTVFKSYTGMPPTEFRRRYSS